MRKLKLLLTFNLFLLLSFGFISPVFAVPLADVGDLDPLVAATTIGTSGAQAEADWLNLVLETSYDSNYIDSNKIGNTFEAVNEVLGQFAFELPNQEGYFLVKTGNGTYTHWLFRNVTSTDWGTVLFGNEYEAEFNGQNITFDAYNIGSISHVVPNGASIPEPATMFLLGTGLVGLAVTGRKKFKK